MDSNNSHSTDVYFHQPGTKERLFFLLSGMIISVPFALLFGSIASSILGISFSLFTTELFGAVLIAPLLEEFAKSYPLFYRHGETERSLVTLGFYTGLGFGIVEFFFYIFLFGAPIIPRVFAVIFHASSTSIVAFGIAKKKTLPFFLLAAAFHFSNNMAAVLGFPWIYVLVATIILAVVSVALFLRFKASPIKSISY